MQSLRTLLAWRAIFAVWFTGAGEISGDRAATELEILSGALQSQGFLCLENSYKMIDGIVSILTVVLRIL